MRDILHTWLKLPHEEQKWIPLEEMKIGNYLCSARNFDIGYWNGGRFEYERTKLNCKFDDTEEHWDTGAPYGTVKPLKYLGDSEQ